jgi:c-di-GMP-binding flagellar brake protein YcgR
MYSKGDLFWVAMLFPTSPTLRVEAVAQVVKAAKPVKRGEKLSGAIVDISSKFIGFNPQDKEEILRYTFQRQREILRARRDD